MRLGYFGGSFDPPHLGHLVVARAAADAFQLDRVLLVPTANQPLKAAGLLAAYADRFAMTTLLCETAVGPNELPDPRLQTSNLEAPSDPIHGTLDDTPPAPNYTVDTLQHLRSMEPTAELYVIVGIDAFHQLPQWRSPDTLLTLADWIVVSRPVVARPVVASSSTTAQLPPLTAAQRERVHLLQSVDEPASASAIRDELARGGDCLSTLPRTIRTYIHTHKLYRSIQPR